MPLETEHSRVRYQLDRAALRIPIDISVPMLALILGEDKVNEAFDQFDVAVGERPWITDVADAQRTWVAGYLRASLSMALGELLNRRMTERAVWGES